MIFDNIKLETEEDIEATKKLLRKVNDCVMHVYGADSDVGIIWLGTTAQLKKTSLFTKMTEERKEKAYTILEDIVKKEGKTFVNIREEEKPQEVNEEDILSQVRDILKGKNR